MSIEGDVDAEESEETSLSFCGENADNEGERAYGREMADKIHQRIDELHAADTVERMIQWNTGRCHLLTQNRKGQYAMDLIHPFRLVFEKKEGDPNHKYFGDSRLLLAIAIKYRNEIIQLWDSL